MVITDSELAALIVKRYKQQYPHINWRKNLLLEPPLELGVIDIFSWAKTKEGPAFWSKVHEKIEYNLSSFLKENLNKNRNFVDLQIFV